MAMLGRCSLKIHVLNAAVLPILCLYAVIRLFHGYLFDKNFTVFCSQKLVIYHDLCKVSCPLGYDLEVFCYVVNASICPMKTYFPENV